MQKSATAQYMSACQMAPKFPHLSASLLMAQIQPCENLQVLPPIIGPMTRQLLLQASPDSISHDYVSTEYHKSAGPFTTVPLPQGRSSLVWMERPARAEALMAMTEKELAAEIQIETHGELGLISNLGPRKSFPMKGLTARQFAKDRLILIGEAAHVVPPIGAQGLNMSLRDAALAATSFSRPRMPEVKV